jgi:hypothetical protein
MVPIYETDLTRERNRPSDWDHYELWEAVELRERKRRLMWILGTLLVSLSLTAIPVISESRSHWVANKLARELAQQVNVVKHRAILSRSPQRIVFDPSGKLRFRMESVTQCESSPATTAQDEYPLQLKSADNPESFRLVLPDQAQSFGLARVIQEFCFDPIHPDSRLSDEQKPLGFALGSVKDLSENHIDSLSVVLIRGPSAEISFN